MARTEKKKDVVLVGFGWTGAILGMELAQEGIEILALERGHDQNTVPDFQYPNMIDELKYGVRLGMMQKPRNGTLTIRRDQNETALPYRSLGTFLPGIGVGGAGTHWNGLNWRPMQSEYRLRSYTEEKFGGDVIPEDMTIQDYPMSYAELEPHFDRFEHVAGISGKAGNINGQIVEGGNPFEAPRSRDYPMPPMHSTWDGKKFGDAAKAMGYHPFPSPGGIASKAYVNEYNMQMGPCNHCGFCERYGCYNYSKSSPQTAIIDALKRKKNFEYRTNCDVLRVEKSADGKTATGVTYYDEKTGEEVFQPADIVILTAFSLHNVHLMLLSGIGKPYDPVTNEGVVGRNYSYQLTGGYTLFFKDEHFNPFIGTGANGMCIDDFGIDNIDFRQEGFIGGAYWRSGQTNGQPIRSMSLPSGTPSWGAGWKKAVGEWYGHSMNIGAHGSLMSYRGNYLDLDPTYKDPRGRAMMRMTFNWQPNDLKMIQFMKSKMEPLVKSMNPDIMQEGFKKDGAMFDVRPYQTTHNTGGAVTGNDPKTSAINRYLQAWDQHNVFVMGASAFPQNTQYNPTGMVGGLAYWAAEHIRKDYLPNPRPLV
jgi:gluconate 2-dehydrogenase alpha chain